MNWKYFRAILPIVGSAIVVGFLFSRFDFLEVQQILLAPNLPPLFFGVTALIVAQPILAFRWKLALSLSGFKLSFGETLKAYLANIPIAKLTPTYSGDFLRALYFKDKVPASIGAGVVLLESLVDISMLTVMVILGSFWTHAYIPATVAILCLSGIILFCVLAQTEWMRTMTAKQSKVQNFLKAVALSRSYPFGIFTLSVLSLISWFLLFLFFYFAFMAFGGSVQLTSIFMLHPLVVLTSLLPITVSGVGIRESGMLVLYAYFASPVIILATGLAYSFFSVVVLPLICLPLTLHALHPFWRK